MTGPVPGGHTPRASHCSPLCCRCGRTGVERQSLAVVACECRAQASAGLFFSPEVVRSGRSVPLSYVGRKLGTWAHPMQSSGVRWGQTRDAAASALWGLPLLLLQRLWRLSWSCSHRAQKGPGAGLLDSTQALPRLLAVPRRAAGVVQGLRGRSGLVSLGSRSA